MKKIIIAINLLLLTASSVASAELLIRPRALLGYTDYKEFTSFLETIPNQSDTTETSTGRSTYVTGGIGVTIASENYYFDLIYTTSFETTIDFQDTEDGGLTFEDDFERNDLSLTLGKTLNNGLAIYVGYKSAKNTSTFSGDEVDEPSKDIFKSTGPYIGVAKSVSLKNASLSFNVAVASLKGKFESTDDTINNLEADNTLGYSLHITYDHFLTADSGMMIKGSFQQYRYDDFVFDGPFDDPLLLGAQVTFDREETIIVAELIYYINF